VAAAGGYEPADLERVQALAGGPLGRPGDIRRVIDALAYEDDWRANYSIKSVRASLHSDRITCIDGAILAYGLLELLFPDTPRQLLAIHRRDGHGEECGHCVALYRDQGGAGASRGTGSFSKSSFPGLGHRDPVHTDAAAVAVSYADAYVKMGFTPLYFGVTTLEEVASDLDWRCSAAPLNVLSERLQARYSHSFGVAA
jgi:hypothetical protein